MTTIAMLAATTSARSGSLIAAIRALLFEAATVISRAVAPRFWGLLAVVSFPLPVAVASILARLMSVAR